MDVSCQGLSERISPDPEKQYDYLMKECEKLKDEKNVLEDGYRKKWSRFKELFEAKDTECKKIQDENAELKKLMHDFEEKLKVSERDAQDLKAVFSVVESDRIEEYEKIKKRYTQDVQSAHEAMRLEIDEIQEELKQSIAREQQSEKLASSLQTEVQKLRERFPFDRDGLLKAISERMRISTSSKVSSDDTDLSDGSQTTNQQISLEQSMAKAKADSDFLKSVILPLEKEITFLKSELESYRKQENEAALADELDSEEIETLSMSVLLDKVRKYQLEKTELSTKLEESQVELKRKDESLQRANDLTAISQERVLRLQRALDEVLSYEEKLKVYERADLQSSKVEATLSSQAAEGGGSNEAFSNHTISQKEWIKVMSQVETLSKILSGECGECLSLKERLHAMEKKLKEQSASSEKMEMSLTWAHEEGKKYKKYAISLENEMKVLAEKWEHKVAIFSEQTNTAKRCVLDYVDQMEGWKNSTHPKFMKLIEESKATREALALVQADNDSLQKTHSKVASELQEEEINLPTQVDDLQFLILKYREDLIAAKVALQHSTKKSNEFQERLVSQLTNLQCAHSSLQQVSSADIAKLQEELALKNSMESEMEREKAVRIKVESRVHELTTDFKDMETEYERILAKLKEKLEKAKEQKNAADIQVSVLNAQLRGRDGETSILQNF